MPHRPLQRLLPTLFLIAASALPMGAEAQISLKSSTPRAAVP
ncbi:hypothetical protein [Paenacidovorax monticola]|nr:hypothetical protein [Paenacidovorax monticola]